MSSGRTISVVCCSGGLKNLLGFGVVFLFFLITFFNVDILCLNKTSSCQVRKYTVSSNIDIKNEDKQVTKSQNGSIHAIVFSGVGRQTGGQGQNPEELFIKFG